MRLTLRTMLAYLDDILDSSDAQALAAKIEESDFASGLVHRIRNSIGRLRLSGPKVLGQGMGADPNTVSEYLDNTLPTDRVPEFEKVCLESDIHLAEVASCHQILTLVLGEPARVEPALRERIYLTASPSRAVATSEGIARQVDEAVASSTLAEADEVEGAPPAEGHDVQPMRPSKHEIPDYLRREPRRRLWPIYVPLLLGFILTAALIVAMGPLNPQHPLAGLLGLGAGDEVAQHDGTLPPLPPNNADSQTDNGTPLDNSAEEPPSEHGQPIANGAQLKPDENQFVPEDVEPMVDATPQIPTDQDDGQWPLPDPRDTAETPEQTQSDPTDPESSVSIGPEPADETVNDVAGDVGTTLPPADVGPTDNSEAVGPDAVNTDNRTPISDINPSPSLTQPELASDVDPGLGTPGGLPVGDDDATDTTLPANDTSGDAESIADTAVPSNGSEASQQEMPTDMGRFFSDDQVLVFWDATEEAWMRLAPRSPLVVGDRFRALPAYRPQLLLTSNDVQATLRGRTEVRVEQPLSPTTPLLWMPFGRALFMSVGQPKSEIGLRLGERRLLIEMEGVDAEFVVEVRPVLLPGSDPRINGHHMVSRLWVTRGALRVDEDTTPSQVVSTGEGLLLIDDQPSRVETFPDLPIWVFPSGDVLVKKAAAELEQLLALDRPVDLALDENAEHRRVDVSALSARSLVVLDRFQAGAGLLSQAKHHPSWRALFDELQAALARGPETAKQVLTAFQQSFGPDGGQLYRMLWGYSEQQLADGAAAQLVDDLTRDELEYRVLAIENLRRITGKTQTFKPEHSDSFRAGAVVRWRGDLKGGKIIYRNRPRPLEVGLGPIDD